MGGWRFLISGLCFCCPPTTLHDIEPWLTIRTPHPAFFWAGCCRGYIITSYSIPCLKAWQCVVTHSCFLLSVLSEHLQKMMFLQRWWIFYLFFLPSQHHQFHELIICGNTLAGSGCSLRSPTLLMLSPPLAFMWDRIVSVPVGRVMGKPPRFPCVTFSPLCLRYPGCHMEFIIRVGERAKVGLERGWLRS